MLQETAPSPWKTDQSNGYRTEENHWPPLHYSRTDSENGLRRQPNRDVTGSSTKRSYSNVNIVEGGFFSFKREALMTQSLPQKMNVAPFMMVKVVIASTSFYRPIRKRLCSFNLPNHCFPFHSFTVRFHEPPPAKIKREQSPMKELSACHRDRSPMPYEEKCPYSYR